MWLLKIERDDVVLQQVFETLNDVLDYIKWTQSDMIYHISYIERNS